MTSKTKIEILTKKTTREEVKKLIQRMEKVYDVCVLLVRVYEDTTHIVEFDGICATKHLIGTTDFLENGFSSKHSKILEMI